MVIQYMQRVFASGVVEVVMEMGWEVEMVMVMMVKRAL